MASSIIISIMSWAGIIIKLYSNALEFYVAKFQAE